MTATLAGESLPRTGASRVFLSPDNPNFLAMVHPLRLLRWLYLGRLTLAAGIFGGALLVWPRMTPEATLLATLVLLLSLVVTLASAWHTHVKGREAGENFLYAQVVFDTLLVTAVVHLTGSAASDFPPLYILVIASGALLLPLPGGVLIGALASILYFADIFWTHPSAPPASIFVQIGLFAVMALVTGYLGDRLRQSGAALGEVRSELRQLRLDTSELLGAIDTGVVTVDAQGRLVYVNAAAKSLLRLHDGARLGAPILDELESRAEGLGEMLRRTVTSGVPVRWFETRTRGRGGVERVLGVRTTLLEREGAPWATIVVQDVTDGKRAEQLHRRAERLAGVAALAASLAHEIKNPLASIRSAVEQLASGKLGGSDQALLERLVVGESERLSRLLSEFIEFSRVEVRRREPVDVAGLTADVIELVRQHPDGANGTRISFELPPEPVPVDGDEDLLHRAIFNLILNAVQHAGAGGGVRIEVARVGEVELPAGVRLQAPVRVVVRDTGPGIPAELVPRVFDPFFSTRKGGTGLGLALVHRAVEAHQGVILVDGPEDGGTQFTVFLPQFTNPKVGA